jgi:peroxidase
MHALQYNVVVQGCDASVLLKPTDANPQPEMLGIPNLSLRGFEVIDAAKAALEQKCPGVVSCADIVAFAGRDASYFLSNYGVDFKMPSGRYDGNVSLAGDTLANLPPPFATVQRLKDMFAAKGLDAVDMVVLSGAHSIGRSQCSSFSDRLPPSNTSDIDPALAAQLKSECESGNTVVQDYKTPNELDNQYYRNVLTHKVLFASDAALLQADDTMRLVYAAAAWQKLWQYKFGEAMVKMSGVEVKTAANGEIRKVCGLVNTPPYSG